MVDNKEDLPNAISLNSAMVNMARLIGPAASGLILQRFGAGFCFILNAISFIAVITSLLLMKFAPFKPATVKKKVAAELAEGFQYIKNTPAISKLIWLMACLALFVLPYDTLEPVFAKVIFKGNASLYGYLAASMGLGALIGTFVLASAKKGTDLRKFLLWSVIVLGAGLILFSQTSYFPLAIPFALIIGLGSLTPMATAITIIQTEAAAHMRGRAMSFAAMSIFGMLPLGSLMIGTISQKIGAPLTMLGQGILAVSIAIIFSRLLNKAQDKQSSETTLFIQ